MSWFLEFVQRETLCAVQKYEAEELWEIWPRCPDLPGKMAHTVIAYGLRAVIDRG